MTPAASVTSDTKQDDPNQGDFISKLFSDKNKLQSLPQEKLDKIVDKLHILPPEKKREALLAMGYKNIKAIEIAEILGMTVAEFNNIMNVNESIKLSEIVKKLQK
jgi:DNA-directed RNA polymerase specialized sigma24 family protein